MKEEREISILWSGWVVNRGTFAMALKRGATRNEQFDSAPRSTPVKLVGP